jgi:tRNA(Ile)-lysidine synthase
MPAPRGIVQRLDQYLHRTDLMLPGMRVLVACSGGADSIALLRLLHAVNQSDHWHWNLVVGHVNHELRGHESASDEAFVRRLAEHLGLPFAVEHLTLRKNRVGHVGENEAREGRLAALRKMVMAQRCDVVCIGHHADDQAETVLMRIIRGCSIHGLGAMAERSIVGGVAIIRPLLHFEQKDLHHYLARIRQPWCEDRTNALEDYLRNRVRHELLPLLEKYQPRVRRAVVRLAEHAREVDDLVQAEVQHLVEREVAREAKGRLLLKWALLKRAAPAVLGRLLQGALVRVGARPDSINTDQLRDAMRAIRTGELGSRFEFARRVILHVGKEQVEVYSEKPQPRAATGRRPRRPGAPAASTKPVGQPAPQPRRAHTPRTGNRP